MLLLRGAALGDDGVRALAASAAFPRLARLELAHNQLGDDGLAALAQGGAFPKCKTLGLAENRFGGPGLAALAAATTWPELREVQVSYCPAVQAAELGAFGLQRRAAKAEDGDLLGRHAAGLAAPLRPQAQGGLTALRQAQGEGCRRRVTTSTSRWPGAAGSSGSTAVTPWKTRGSISSAASSGSARVKQPSGRRSGA